MPDAAKDALRLAEESFRHSWDMSDERLIDGAWVAGLCCECGDFVPYGQEVTHVAAALAPLIDGAKAEERERVAQALEAHAENFYQHAGSMLLEAARIARVLPPGVGA